MKTVQVLGHSFDCLPGHVTIAGKGSGSNLRVATKDAVDSMLSDERLSHKRISNFKITVVVTENGNGKHD